MANLFEGLWTAFSSFASHWSAASSSHIHQPVLGSRDFISLLTFASGGRQPNLASAQSVFNEYATQSRLDFTTFLRATISSSSGPSTFFRFCDQLYRAPGDQLSRDVSRQLVEALRQPDFLEVLAHFTPFLMQCFKQYTALANPPYTHITYSQWVKFINDFDLTYLGISHVALIKSVSLNLSFLPLIVWKDSSCRRSLLHRSPLLGLRSSMQSLIQ